MAQGRIVAASDVGGHRELITDGLTGVLFPPDDPAACARVARRRSWAERTSGRRCATWPGRHVAAHHDWARNVLRYRPVYQALLEPSGQSSRLGSRLIGRRARRLNVEAIVATTAEIAFRDRRPRRQAPISAHPAFPRDRRSVVRGAARARQPGAARGAARKPRGAHRPCSADTVGSSAARFDGAHAAIALVLAAHRLAWSGSCWPEKWLRPKRPSSGVASLLR